jgi:hypothetical protein
VGATSEVVGESFSACEPKLLEEMDSGSGSSVGVAVEFAEFVGFP